MKINVATKFPYATTAEGGRAARNTPELELRRLTAACMLWEDNFYISGKSIADRIAELIPKVTPEFAAAVAADARGNQKLRHVPLLIVREMARHPKHSKLVGKLLADIILRADEITEFLAIYWKDKRQPLSKQVKLGLARAFLKFDEYALAKYNRDGAVKLRDALFLCHAKPDTPERDALWKKLINNQLTVPDTWEVALSAGADKKLTFERLMAEKKLGGLAYLRNLRNMVEAGVPRGAIRDYATHANFSRVLPFRFIAAARVVPQMEDVLEPLMLDAVKDMPKFDGATAILIDVSGSMASPISSKSDLSRLDAAKALAILLREQCENGIIFKFNQAIMPVAPRRGFALADAIGSAHGSTYLGGAVQHLNATVGYSRLIVLTDEQAHDTVPNPKARGYMINVASNQHGVGSDTWERIFGWSENIVSHMHAVEAMDKS